MADLGQAGGNDLFDQRGGQRIFGREEHAGFRGLKWRAVDMGDDAPRMRVEAEVVFEGGVACGHFARWMAKAGHGVGHAFGMVGEQGAELRSQGLGRGLEDRGEGREVGFDRICRL